MFADAAVIKKYLAADVLTRVLIISLPVPGGQLQDEQYESYGEFLSRCSRSHGDAAASLYCDNRQP